MQRLGKDIQKELTGLCSKKNKSVFRDVSPEKISSFSWDKLITDLEKRAPTFHTLLHGCAEVKRRERKITTKKLKRPNKVVVGVCASLILQHKNHNMNVLQRIVSLILHRGHAAKQVTKMYFIFVFCMTLFVHLKFRYTDGFESYAFVYLIKLPTVCWIS